MNVSYLFVYTSVHSSHLENAVSKVVSKVGGNTIAPTWKHFAARKCLFFVCSRYAPAAQLPCTSGLDVVF